VARRNVERHGLAQRIALRRADLLDGLPGGYDLILCNPPYVNAASMAALPAEYRAEPALALAGGADGMDLVRRILRDAPAAMHDGAVLVLEVGHERAHFERAFPRLEVVWLETSAGGDAVLLATREALAAELP
jgi:ribosomal protein L3 glutamine methyltransferase